VSLGGQCCEPLSQVGEGVVVSNLRCWMRVLWGVVRSCAGDCWHVARLVRCMPCWVQGGAVQGQMACSLCHVGCASCGGWMEVQEHVAFVLKGALGCCLRTLRDLLRLWK